jgi:hypothetical protein
VELKKNSFSCSGCVSEKEKEVREKWILSTAHPTVFRQKIRSRLNPSQRWPYFFPSRKKEYFSFFPSLAEGVDEFPLKSLQVHSIVTQQSHHQKEKATY